MVEKVKKIKNKANRKSYRKTPLCHSKKKIQGLKYFQKNNEMLFFYRAYQHMT